MIRQQDQVQSIEYTYIVQLHALPLSLSLSWYPTVSVSLALPMLF